MEINNKYEKIRDLFRKEDTSFTCAICDKKLKTFHSSHLKTHGINKDEYIEKYGYPNKHIEKKYLIEEIVDKVGDLYVSQFYKWIYLSKFSSSYVTVQPDQETHRNMYKYDIERHLRGDNTLAVLPYQYYSKWLILDIDTYDSKDENGISWSSRPDAMALIGELKHVLKGYFPDDEIHITSSGGKGYHLELFFDKHVPIKDLARVFSILLNEVVVERYAGVNVEMRPELKGLDGRGVKVALGRNHTNPDYEKNYCGFLDDNFMEIQNEIEYVLNIKKSDSTPIYEMIEAYESDKIKNYRDKYVYKSKQDKNIQKIQDKKSLCSNSEKVVSNSEKEKFNHISIRNYYKYGLEQPGTRHDISFKIAILLKDDGYDEEEIKRKLYTWTEEQVKRGMSKGRKAELVKDIESIIKDVFKKDCHLPKPKDVCITKSDLKMFEKLHSKSLETKKRVINHQKILFAMIVHSRRYAAIDRKFYMTYEQIMESADIGSKTTVSKVINQLNEWGFIEIITRNKKVHDKSKINLPNTYKIGSIEDDKNDKVFQLCDNKILCKNCYLCMVKQSYTIKDLDRVTSRRIKDKIKKLDNKECTMVD